MNSYKKIKLSDFVYMNPSERLPKGTIARKISMDQIEPYKKFVFSTNYEQYSGGAKFRNGDTIMARITPCLENGKTAFVSGLAENEIAFGSTEYIVLRAKENISIPDFVYYLAISSIIREPAIKSMVGSSGRQRVQQSVLDELEIPLFSIADQQHIVDILGTLDDKIENLEKTNTNLQELCLIKFRNIFSEVEKTTLSDIAVITMGQSPAGNTLNEYTGTVFYQGRTDFGFRYPTIRLYTSEPKRIAKTNDILLSVRAPVGDVNIAFEDCCIGRGIAAISSEYRSFVYYALIVQSADFDIYNNSGTIFGSINKEALASFKIPASNMELVKTFEKFANAIDTKIYYNTLEISKMKKLKELYLQKFFG